MTDIYLFGKPRSFTVPEAFDKDDLMLLEPEWTKKEWKIIKGIHTNTNSITTERLPGSPVQLRFGNWRLWVRVYERTKKQSEGSGVFSICVTEYVA
jgi:hypothetical protein